MEINSKKNADEIIENFEDVLEFGKNHNVKENINMLKKLAKTDYITIHLLKKVSNNSNLETIADKLIQCCISLPEGMIKVENDDADDAEDKIRKMNTKQHVERVIRLCLGKHPRTIENLLALENTKVLDALQERANTYDESIIHKLQYGQVG